MKKILITGGSGFLGSHIVECFLNRGFSVTILSRNNSSLDHPGKINYIHGELLSLTVELINTYDLVIHSAAIKPGNNNESDFRLVNEVATKHLIRICESACVKRFIYISTMAVDCERSDNYASSKRTAEYLVKESSLDWTILRISAVYGLSDWWLSYLRLLRQKRFLFIIGNGQQPSYQIYVKDCALAITNACFDQSINQQVCCITADPIAYNDFLSVVKSTLNANFIRVYVPFWFSRLIGSLLLAIFNLSKPHLLNDPHQDLSLKGALRLNVYARPFDVGLADMISDMRSGNI